MLTIAINNSLASTVCSLSTPIRSHIFRVSIKLDLLFKSEKEKWDKDWNTFFIFDDNCSWSDDIDDDSIALLNWDDLKSTNNIICKQLPWTGTYENKFDDMN